MKRTFRLLVAAFSAVGILTASALPAAAHHHSPLVDGDLYDVLSTTVDLAWATLDGSGEPVSVMGPVTEVQHTYNQATDSFTELARVTVDGNGLKVYTSVSDSGSGWACVNNRTNPRFRALWVATAFREDARSTAQHKFHTYQQDFARTTGDLNETKQIEVCAVGGSDAQNGWRLLEAGSAMATTKNTRNLLARKAAFGTTTSSTTASLTMNASYNPVTISGTITQNYTGENGGKPGSGPYPLPTDAFAETAAVGWWHNATSCCGFNQGSTHYQGTVHHALYEFTQSEPRVHITMNGYETLRCGSVNCP